ncbi:MAG: hypothetical protein KDB36_01740, partial [Acidimicrobiales bacterium]|nr:hypothetical protein [Acidimicrobiales bacterium]
MPATRPQAAVVRRGYRLRLSPLNRWGRTAALVVFGGLFVDGILRPQGDGVWQVLSVIGLASSLWGLRILHGPAIVVRPSGLRVEPRWPLRRDIAWYRIYGVDVIPGTWTLEVELNPGERVSLACVDRVDDLYERVEAAR